MRTPCLALLVVLTAGPAWAANGAAGGGRLTLARPGVPGALGLGLGLGSPTSLNGKYFLDEDLAVDFGLDLVGPRSGLGFHADAIWHLGRLASEPRFEVPFYAGVGARATTWHGGWWWKDKYYFYDSGGLDVAARAPLGAAIWIKPAEIYLEAGPELWLLPPSLELFATLGFRLFF